MDPLSAFRVATAPSTGLQGATLAGGLPKTIPSSELAGLIKSNPTGDLDKFGGATPLTGVESAGNASFTNVLSQMVGDVNGKQVAAGDAVTGLLGGGNVSLHQAMIAMEEANVSFQLMVQVRNKLLESYQELMRMQV